MSLADGYFDLPPGKLANVVTHLEMRERAPARAELSGGYALHRVQEPALDWYLQLFRRVGEPYLWGSRLLMPPERLAAVLRDPLVEIYTAKSAGGDAALVELDFRTPGECELVFFGLTPEHVGKGAGRALMNRTIDAAWSHPISRFWLHTCTLDHPRALDFYIRSGFVPFKRQMEIHDDPRVLGIYARTAAPNVPVL